MGKPLPGVGHWSVEPRPYVGDARVIYVGFCHDCDHDTGKCGGPVAAAKRVSDHWVARHGEQ